MISDDGDGIMDGAHVLICERFVSFGDHRGTGLGWPIARAIARAHGGDLTYEADRFLLRFASARDLTRWCRDR